MVDKVQLNANLRENLVRLKDTSSLTDRTQVRLATGQDVNKALDNAASFFSSQALESRAGDLLGLKDNIDQAISSLNAAIQGIEAITTLVEQAKGIALAAKGTQDIGERASLAAQYDALRGQIDQLAEDASYAELNLISSAPDNLVVNFNEDSTSSITVNGIDSTTAGLGIGGSIGGFQLDTFIDIAIAETEAAISTLRTSAATFGSNTTVLQTRLNFTEDLTNTLQDGSGKLILSDLNEESANLVALQTRQQLGINSLSLSVEKERQILEIFS